VVVTLNLSQQYASDATCAFIVYGDLAAFVCH
jgi:hypothetical protein